MVDSPQPLTQDFKSQPLSIQRVMLSHAIGECLMAWSQVEHTLHGKFCQQLVRQSRNKQRWVIAGSIWSEVYSFKTRLDMTTAAINGTLYKLETRRFNVVRDDWRVLHNYIAKMSGLRNEIAHGTMVNMNGEGIKIVPYATTIPYPEAISCEEVQRRARLFVELDAAIMWHDLASSALWKPKLKRFALHQQPIPHLVLELRKNLKSDKKASSPSANGRNRKRKRAHRRTSRR